MPDAPTPVVFIIDDDASVRRSLARLLAAEGFHTEALPSATAYLALPPNLAPACLVVDYAMPGLDGLELQAALAARGSGEHMVFISAHADIPVCSRAMKSGAVDFLAKPFRTADLIAAVRTAVARSLAARQATARSLAASAVLARLTPRESEVFALIVAGLATKEIASRLGSAEKTVRLQRSSIIAKLGISSPALMARLADCAAPQRADPAP